MPAAVVSRATSSSAPTPYADIEPVRICVTQFNRPLRDIRLLADNLVQKLKEFGARQVKQFGLEDHVISLFVPAATEWRMRMHLRPSAWRRSEERFAEGSGKAGLRKERFCCPGW